MDHARFRRRTVLGAILLGACASSQSESTMTNDANVSDVRFATDGAALAGHLYRPDTRATAPWPALVIGGSLTSVKEMMGARYAAEMTRRGYATLAIDYRGYGQSGGTPRQYEDPELKTRDVVAALDYLSSRPDIAKERLGLLGVCTSAGTMLYAAARDDRVRAVVGVAGHYAEPGVTPDIYGGHDGVERRRAAGRAARAKWLATGENEFILAYSNTDRTASHVENMDYYMDPTRGGGVPQWRNEFAVQSWEPWLDFNPVAQATRVQAPTLVVHTDGCAMPAQARKTFANLAGPKDLVWTEGDHFEFYDGPERIRAAADAAAAHFQRFL